jgi:hypothetical protein
MSKLRHFLERMGWLKPDPPEAAEPPKPFWEELKAELRKRLVGYSATFIFGVIGLVFFLMGGYIVYDWIQDTKDRRRNFHEVCIDGYVFNTYEGTAVENAMVFIEGNSEWTNQSNNSGYFRICINIPKTQATVNLTIEKAGYIRQYYHQVSVPDNPHAEKNIQHFNLTNVKNVEDEPFPH